MKNREQIRIPIPIDYILKNKEADHLLILLHGFTQTAEKILKNLEPHLPQNVALLAINGTFPLPQRKEDKWVVGCSWYFYDSDEDQYLVDQEPSSLAIEGLVNTLGLIAKKKTIIGYSQGGYLAPFAAQKLKNVGHVIGISCQFLKDEIQKPLYRIDAIHGENDQIVDPILASKLHKELIAEGAQGSFTLVKGEGHKLSPGLLEPVSRLLQV